MLSATSGTTTAGELLETPTPLMLVNGGDDSAMPPPINATDGIAAQIRRQGTVNVRGSLFDMLLPWSNQSRSDHDS